MVRLLLASLEKLSLVLLDAFLPVIAGGKYSSKNAVMYFL